MTITAGSSEVTTIKMTFRPRGGRTLIVRPDGSRGVVRREATIDNTMIKVIARGFRWQRLLYEGTHLQPPSASSRQRLVRQKQGCFLRLAYEKTNPLD